MRKILSIAALLYSVCAFAQKGNIGFVYPAGAQRGTTVEITVGGQNLSKAQGIIVSGEGVSGELIVDKSAKQAKKKSKKRDIGEEDNLQLADQVKFRLTIDKNAEPGMRDLRLVMENGVTNRLYFEVGQLPDVLEDGKALLSASASKLPVTFNGQIMRSDVDRFRFKANKGQQLVIRVHGREFVPYMADAVPGWFQPIIRLFGPDGKEVAFCDDYSFHVDPVLFYKVPESGEYDVQINDALYRGREDFVYRIDVGELPFITSISPLGGTVGQTSIVHLRGYNLKKNSIKIKPQEEGFVPVCAVSKKGLYSNCLFFNASSGNISNGSEILIPGDEVESVVRKSMEQHWYTLSVPKKGLYHLSVTARHLGAPTDMRMTIYKPDGSVLKDIDDSEDPDDCMTTHFADPDFTTQLGKGNYKVRLVEAQGKAGEEYAYIFKFEKAVPDFSVHIEPSVVSIPEDGTGYFNVILTRKQNFKGEVQVKIDGLPEGYIVKGTTIAAGQNKTLITVSAPAGAEHKVIHPHVTASARKAGVEITREATAVESMMQAFYYTHLMPIDEFRMEAGASQAFKMEATADPADPMKLKVKLVRDPNFNSAVTIMMRSSLSGVRAEAIVIPEGCNEGTLQMISTRKAKAQVAGWVVVYGVVKGSSGKIAGQARNAYVATVTAYAPAVSVSL